MLYPIRAQPKILIEYDRKLRSESGIPIEIVYRICHRKSDQILFPINFLIGFYFRLDFPSYFCPLSDRKSYRHFGLGGNKWKGISNRKSRTALWTHLDHWFRRFQIGSCHLSQNISFADLPKLLIENAVGRGHDAARDYLTKIDSRKCPNINFKLIPRLFNL